MQVIKEKVIFFSQRVAKNQLNFDLSFYVLLFSAKKLHK